MIRVLDLFCGAGGAGYGYQLAGYEITGVDIKPQKHYPGEFWQADALTFPLDGYDFIHASPPCQRWSIMTKCRGDEYLAYPDLVQPVRERLMASGIPYVIENVPQAPVRQDLLLCGTSFGLRVKRHRVFEFPAALESLFEAWPGCGDHNGIVPFRHRREELYRISMGCEWMTNRESRQAIPPAYTRYIGERIKDRLCAGAGNAGISIAASAGK